MDSDIIKRGEIQKIQSAINSGIDVNQPNAFGELPLITACHYGYFEIVQLLIANGAKVNQAGNLGETALHAASRKGNIEILFYLLSEGANINKPNSSGETPLHLACINGNFDTVQILVQNGANVNMKTKEGQTPLHLTAKYGVFNSIKIISFLMDHFADKSIRDMDGNTPFDIALKSNNVIVVEFLSKRLDKKNLQNPLNVYFPRAHSSEDCKNPRKLVPKDSLFVSFGKCGLASYRGLSGFYAMVQDIKHLGPNAFQKYSKPVEFREEIYDIVQSFIETKEKEVKRKGDFGRSIYHDYRLKVPGQSLPNIRYSFLSVYDQKKFLFSGLIPLSKMLEPGYHADVMTWQGDFTIDFFRVFIPSLFRYSVVPTEAQIAEAFKDEESILRTIYPKTPKPFSEYIEKEKLIQELGSQIHKAKIFRYNVSDLMKKFPGVYYHTSCRGVCELNPDADELIRDINVLNTNYPDLDEENVEQYKQVVATRRLSINEQRRVHKKKTRKHKKKKRKTRRR